MELGRELEQFRQEAQRLKAGRRSGSLPFPEALRAFAVRYAEHTVAASGSMTDAAKKLGVSGPTLYEWRKGCLRPKGVEKSAVLVPVRVSARSATGAGVQQVAVVPPGGWRVEGLSVERGTEVAALFYLLIEAARLRGDDPGQGEHLRSSGTQRATMNAVRASRADWKVGSFATSPRPSPSRSGVPSMHFQPVVNRISVKCPSARSTAIRSARANKVAKSSDSTLERVGCILFALACLPPNAHWGALRKPGTGGALCRI